MRLRRTFDLLAENPRLARERTELSPPVRVHPCGAHVVIYTVEDDGTVLIVRVRHGREDWAGSP
jgi:toxin ParE1/3/4